jgi:hypothetical protein
MSSNDAFTSQDVTYKQLQSSGNFRYIDNKELYKQIADYYNLYERYLLIIEGQFDPPSGLTVMEAKLFNGSDLASMTNPNPTNIQSLFNRPAGKFQTVVDDPYYLNYLFIKASNRAALMKGSVTWLAWLKTKASMILVELEKEYRL